MPVIQVNIWICEVCGNTYTKTGLTSPFSDPVVVYPTEEAREYIGDKDVLACPQCVLASTISPFQQKGKSK